MGHAEPGEFPLKTSGHSVTDPRDGLDKGTSPMSSQPIVTDELASENSETAETHVAAQEVDAVSTETRLKTILADILALDPNDADALTVESGLFGHLPELDSMAVAGLLTEIEDRFDIVIEDDDVDGEMLEAFGGLLAFVEAKLEES